MPLAKSPDKPPAEPVQVMNFACQYCGHNHRLRPEKIPPAVKALKCISCGRPVPIDRAAGTAPVHSLKRETSTGASERPASTAEAPAAPDKNLLRFRCSGCGKKYKIDQNKIPPRIAAVTCRACGNNIKLPLKTAIAKSADDAPADMQPEPLSPGDAQMQSRMPSPPAAPRRRKKWLFAAAACILLVVTASALVKFDIVKLDWLNQFIPLTAEKSAEPSPLVDIEPFLALNLNIPGIVDEIENRLEPDKKTDRTLLMVSMMKSMDLHELQLYLYSDRDNQLLPVVLVHGSSAQKLENAFNKQDSLKKYFTRKSAGSYRLNTESLNDAQKQNLPGEPYQLTILDEGAALAPISLSAMLAENPEILKNSPVAIFARSVAGKQDLASIAIRVPEDIHQGWEKKIQNHPTVRAAPQAAMIAGMGAAIMSQLTGSLKQVDMLAMGFRFTGQTGRALSYAQQFRPAVDGEKIYRQLSAAEPTDADSSGIIRNLIKLFKDQRYQHRLDFKDNRLALKFSWTEKEDEAFMTALTAATVGQMLAGSMVLSPSPGAVQTRYAPEPVIVAAVDMEKLKAQIPQVIKESLFPGHYWSQGDKPRMTLDIDTVDLPNAAMAELTYEVRSIKSPGGKEVLRIEESQFQPRIQPGSLFPGNLALNVKQGTPPKDLGTASIFFHLTVPVAVEIFDFAAGDPEGRSIEANGIRASLRRLEKDVAQVNSSGGKSMRLIAYDQTGRALASRESMSSATSISTRFEGIISTLKVVVTREVLEHPFGIEVDLNSGKELALTREPEIPARMRFNPHPVPTYVNFKEEDLKELAVQWTEGDERSWNDSLTVTLPGGPFSGHAKWEAHFFSNDRPLFLAGNSSQGPMDFSFTLEKGKLKQTGAAFGKAEINLHSEISRLVFVSQSRGQPAAQTLPSGDKVSIDFNKNEITYNAGRANVIQTVAYDSRGKRLKQDQYTRNKGGNRVIYYWGVPAKFEIDVSTRTIARLIPFEITRRPVDQKAFQAFKQTIENQREVVKAIKTIDRARRRDRSYYGDDLAGLYYLHHTKTKEPLKLIAREIAHSDPKGQKRFGYKVKPYKGYYFTVLAGVESNGAKTGYNRRSKKSSFSWQNGSITTTSLTRHPDLAAIPEDRTQPTFFLQWGQVFKKPLNGEKLEYLPDGYYNKGWVEAKFIE